MCRPGWARMCPQWGGRTHAEKLPARWEPPGPRLPAPRQARSLYQFIEI